MSSFFIILFLFTSVFQIAKSKFDEKEIKYWNEQGQSELRRMLNLKQNTNIAKNVIMFVGDGMGPSSIAAGRIYKGQKKNRPGEEESLTFDLFKDIAQIKTYNLDQQVPDSAGTATAFLSGVKCSAGIIGLGPKAVKGKCSTVKGNEVTSILQWSQLKDKSTGFVTTSRVTHASPAALYAHCPHRDWESDNLIPIEDKEECRDIARQLVDSVTGRNIKVIMGGGSRHFYPAGSKKFPHPEKNKRTDNLDLVEMWKQDKIRRSVSHSFVSNTEQMKNLDSKTVDYVLGLFAPSHMSYELDRNRTLDGEPSLPEMTEKAIDLLSKDPKGYFLFVEGARIDHAHHDNYAVHAVEEMLQFDKAVEVALKKTSKEDTLIVVTADHSHSLKFTGNQPRGSDILGVADRSQFDQLRYTTLLYTSGPGYVEDVEKARRDMETFKIDKNYQYLATVPRNWSAHSGEDVQAYAYGPMSHLFRGTQEQSYIAHAMAYASCVGQNEDHCHTQNNDALIMSAMPFIVTFNILLLRFLEKM